MRENSVAVTLLTVATANALASKIVPVTALSSSDREEMWSLYRRFYSGTHRDLFERDLAQKDSLLLLHDAEQRIQVAWGIADFRHRFGHAPDGMWLAETAADSASLGELLDHGIRYTVLAPWQADGPIDPSEPYWVKLADGRRIAAFFYNGDLSGRVSFDSSLTTNADVFGLKDLPRHVDPTRPVSTARSHHTRLPRSPSPP